MTGGRMITAYAPRMPSVVYTLPAESTKFFEPHGWREAVFRSMGEEARRLNRGMRFMWLWRIIAAFYPRRWKEQMKRFSGIVLLERSTVP